jgi:hypothetical protein
MSNTMSKPELTIDVYADDFKTALKHGMELWWDGSTPTKRLDQRGGRNGFTRFVNARAEGKLSEVAFSRFLKYEYGIESQVDWRIYGSYEETDEGDLQYLVGDDGDEYTPAVEFDVKKTKPWNSWLAIRTEIFEPHPENAPFILTKLTLEDDLMMDEWADTDDWTAVETSQKFDRRFNRYVSENFPLEVEIVGTAYPDEFTDHFDKGDKLYDPDTGRKLGGPLRRPNKGIHVDDLIDGPQRWNRIVEEITGDNPISYELL